MAAYPSIGRLTTVKPISRRKVDISDAGTIRSADYNEETVYAVDIRHPLIDATDLATLQAFYDAEKNNVVQVTHRGVTYDCQFTRDIESDDVSPAWVNASADLVGVKQ